MDWTLIISFTVIVVITLVWTFISKKNKANKKKLRRKWKSMSKSEQVTHVDTVMDKWFGNEDYM